jgi:hypothetical protein
MPMNIMSPFLSEPKLYLRVCRESEGMTLSKMNEEGNRDSSPPLY